MIRTARGRISGPAQRAGRSSACSPADCERRRFARYNGKPQDPLLALPKR